MASRSSLSIWLQAVRAFSFPASIVPVLVGAAIALSYEGGADWRLFPLVVVCSVLFQAATNVISDYFDFKKGVDQDYTFGSSRVLTEGLLEPKHLLVGGWLIFAVACLLGLVLVAFRGVPMLVLGVVGLIGGYCYTGTPIGYKYLALGDLFVFILMGPLMVIGSYLALTGHYDASVLCASLPVGCLVAAILNANNLRDIAHDAEAKVKTMAIALGHRAAKGEYVALVAGAYVAVGAMVFTGTVPRWSLLVLLSLPPAIGNVRAILRSREGEPEDIAVLDARTAQHHLLFGLLFALGIALGSWVG